jgi:hypothetical protein
MTTALRAGLLVLAQLVVAAPAAAALPPCNKAVTTNCVTSVASSDGFGTGGTASGGESGGGAAKTSNSGGQSGPTVITQKQHVPTCSENTADDSGVLCGAAVQSCPVEGEIRFWVYTRQYNLVTDTPLTAWTRVTEPATVCLGPEDPVIDPLVAIPALVQRDFQRVVVLKGVAEVSPKPDTLVNIPTVFTTSTPRSYDIPLSLLGQSVVITATAERYTWHFGDGASLSTSEPGGRVEHEYSKAGARQAYVVIEWSGTFRVNGGASQPIAGRATTTGEPTDVQVKQARTELVRD